MNGSSKEEVCYQLVLILSCKDCEEEPFTGIELVSAKSILASMADYSSQVFKVSY